MQKANRNSFVDGSWILKQVDVKNTCDIFDCDDADLNEYFHIDAVHHREDLLTQTFSLELSKYPGFVIALLDFCNDVINLDKLKANHPDIGTRYDYHYRNLPAVKLTRLGVLKELQGQSIGTKVLNMVKRFFITDNRTGCRFITVDAYNNNRVLNFYHKNGFVPLKNRVDKGHTQILFYDLKPLANASLSDQ